MIKELGGEAVTINQRRNDYGQVAHRYTGGRSQARQSWATPDTVQRQLGPCGSLHPPPPPHPSVPVAATTI